MATDLKSRIILAKNIKVDRNYNNVLSYSEDEMLSLCQTNKVIEADNYSFIRTNQTILCGFDYEICLQANYIAFQNPDYSNKWFFAWIDEVNYKGDNNTEIVYTIDSWSTWFDYWQPQTCFVIREHVNDDTIGLHTINENLNVGEIIEETESEDVSLSQYTYLAISSSWNPATEKQFSGITVYNNQVFGNEIHLISMNPVSNLSNFLLYIKKTNSDDHIEDIKDVFIIPDALITPSSLILNEGSIGEQDFSFYTLPFSTSNASFTTNIEKRYTFSDYTPKNNKCFVYPYNYLYVSNNVGNQNIYKYEDFSNNDYATFETQLAISVGVSGRLVPKNYRKKITDDDESLPLAKYPTCCWSVDSYINWLTQNAVNLPQQIFNNLLMPFSSLNPIQIGANTVNAIADSISPFYEASLMPNIEAPKNVGDVNYSAKRNTFTFRCMRVKTEFLQTIDDYFTRFGYKINRVKVPNITGRQNFNFVEIGSEDVIGYGTVPSNYMNNINNACRKGVTIWHNHTNLGNFNVSNNII